MSQQTQMYVRVTPRSGRDEVLGIKRFEDGVDAVCVRVTAPPDAGKANKAVCKVLASALRVPKTSITVISGETARRKKIAVDADEAIVQNWLASLPRIES